MEGTLSTIISGQWKHQRRRKCNREGLEGFDREIQSFISIRNAVSRNESGTFINKGFKLRRPYLGDFVNRFIR